MPFERYATGEDLFASLDKEFDLLDRDLRPFIEEADQMQGIQVLTGLDDAWGGFAAKYLERVRDEYGKTAVFVWGNEHGDSFKPEQTREKRLLRLANKARTLTEVYKYASVVVPFTVPFATLDPTKLALDAGSQWHNTALLATAMESVTLPSRLRDKANRDTLGTLADTLNAMGKQNVASLGMSFAPQPIDEEEEEGSTDLRQRQLGKQKQSGHAAVMAKENPEGVFLDINFTPSDQLDYIRRRGGGDGGDKRPRMFSQVITSRGYEVDDEAQEAEEAEEDERFRRKSSYEPVTRRYVFPSFSFFMLVVCR